MIIIGITGTQGSGKGTVVDYLKEKYDFKHFSSPEFLREEAVRRSMPINRDSLHFIGNELRTTYGAGYIAERIYNQAVASGGNAVLESLRAIGEITLLRSMPEPFYLLAIDADPKIRYERVIKRGSFKDQVSYEKFITQEQAEMYDTSPGGMNIAECMKMADGHIENSGNVEDLQKAVDAIVQALLADQKTPRA